MFRKVLSVLAVASLLMVNVTIVNAKVSGVADYAQGAVSSFADRGILSVDGDFQGSHGATRAFFAMLLAKSIGLAPVDAETPTFKDVPKTHEAYKYIEALELKGKITGDTDSEGNRLFTFRPDDKLNRAEAATMAVGILDLTVYTPAKPTFKDVDEGAWYYNAMETARKYSVIRGFSDSNGDPTGDAGPSASLIRQDAVILANNAENPTEVADMSYRTEVAPVQKKEQTTTTTETKKEVDKKDPVVTTDAGNGEFHNANYTGPFPAPDGVVLSGTYGKDEYKMPSGNGAYKFKLQTAWEKPVACLDDSRIRIGSKGKTWEDGWSKGYNVGRAEYDSLIVPAYNETPQGSLAGNAYYDEGYRLGYSRARDGMSHLTAEYECPGSSISPDMYDSNGWYKYKGDTHFEDFPSLQYVYGPSSPYGGVTYSSQSLLGADSESLTFSPINAPIHEVDTNSGKAPLNLRQIDILDVDLTADEQAMSTEELAQAIYDINKNDLQTKSKVCVLGEPAIVTKTYGANEFVLLSYVQGCSSNVNQIGYALKKNNSNNRILTLYFSNRYNDVGDDSADGIDETRIMSADFIGQFLAGVKYE